MSSHVIMDFQIVLLNIPCKQYSPDRRCEPSNISEKKIIYCGPISTARKNSSNILYSALTRFQDIVYPSCDGSEQSSDSKTLRLLVITDTGNYLHIVLWHRGATWPMSECRTRESSHRRKTPALRKTFRMAATSCFGLFSIFFFFSFPVNGGGFVFACEGPMSKKATVCLAIAERCGNYWCIKV
ncbi:hypothetical protein B0J12DRAFT_638039 [Macrophomina phaseolina]|uniref:Uncharacterized protein n=1 Tax=Macrophomina phaseolina TaxID=35725 RepID=A0ABQ8GX93_9PEZI|nr:hypothetical protein B0J12DRAFT_638039 [Macrophomina phaseolina]